MKNKFLFIVLIVGIILIGGLANCSKEKSTKSESVTIKFGYKSSTETDQHKFFSEMVEVVKEQTDGRITIELYPNAQLGENKEIVEQALLGGDMMGQVSPGDLGEYIPDYGILPGPYLFDSWEHFLYLVNSPLVREWDNRLSEVAGINVVSYMYFGIRDLYTGTKEVRSLQDLKGLKIRVQPVKVYVEMIKALGAVPTPLPWAEVYSALAQGLVDGAEAPPRAVYDYKHNENAKYFILDDHILDASAIFVSSATLTKINDSDKEIFIAETQKAVDKISKANLLTRDDFIKKIEESGVTIVKDIDREPFKNAVKNVYEQFPEWSPGLYKNVKKVLAEYK